MKAWEVLTELCGIEKCPECNCAVGDDTEYKDFTCKGIAICAQCGEEFNIDELMEQALAKAKC